MYRWALAILVLTGLIQSIYQNTKYFLGNFETENVYKYFIYLTNNGRSVWRKYLLSWQVFSILRLVAVFSFSLDAILVSIRLYKEKKQNPDSTGRKILNDSSEEERLRHEEPEDDTASVEKLPIVYKILWILCNINSSLSVLITIGRSQRLYSKDLTLCQAAWKGSQALSAVYYWEGTYDSTV